MYLVFYFRMSWIFFALLSPAFFGIANILDNFLVNQPFRLAGTLVFYSSVLNVAFLPVVFVFGLPSVPSVSLWPALFFVAAMNVLYLYPYYRALQSADTSVVSSLFDLGKIFVPILAFFLVGERLRTVQYAGFAVIIASSMLLSLRPGVRIRLNRSFFHMMLASICVAAEFVVYKYMLEEIDWVTAFFWPTLISGILVLPTLASRAFRGRIHTAFSSFQKVFAIFILEEFATFLAIAVLIYSASGHPISVVEGVQAVQAFFVLGFALCLRRFWPRFFKEDVRSFAILKKSLLFLCMIVGVILVVK